MLFPLLIILFPIKSAYDKIIGADNGDDSEFIDEK